MPLWHLICSEVLCLPMLNRVHCRWSLQFPTSSRLHVFFHNWEKLHMFYYTFIPRRCQGWTAFFKECKLDRMAYGIDILLHPKFPNNKCVSSDGKGQFQDNRRERKKTLSSVVSVVLLSNWRSGAAFAKLSSTLRYPSPRRHSCSW